MLWISTVKANGLAQIVNLCGAEMSMSLSDLRQLMGRLVYNEGIWSIDGGISCRYDVAMELGSTKHYPGLDNNNLKGTC